MTFQFQYLPKSEEQLKANYRSRINKELNSFSSFEAFKTWYNGKPKVCHYCGITEEESQKIVRTGLLTSNRFPENGITGRGRGRGMWLEVDRVNPKANYSEENCVLCCYFCNNDKSDVFYGEEYKAFFQNRVGYLRELLNRANDNR